VQVALHGVNFGFESLEIAAAIRKQAAQPRDLE
jgi:hypothetical protein